jgi:PAS domain S-box-containing protein
LQQLSNSYGEALRTAHQKSQDLKLLSDRFHATLGSIGDGVLATDERGYIVFMNAIAEELCGWRMDDAVGRPAHEVFRIVNETTREAVTSPVETALRTGQISLLAQQTVLLAKDGREIPVEDSGAPIRNESGKIAGAVLVFRDVAERRAAERERDKALQDLSKILEATPDGVYELDEQGRVLFINKAGAATFGYTPEELIGQHIHDLTHHSHADGTLCPWQDCKIRKAILRGERMRNESDLFWRRDRTNFPVLFSAIPVAESGSARMVVVFRDVTEERRKEEALLRSEKLAATGQLASNMAHEVNNPLEAVTNVVYLMQQMLADQPQIHSLLEMADTQLRRVVHIVQRTLGLYREGAQERHVSLAPLCREVTGLYGHMIEAKGLQFTCECDESVHVFGYANELLHTIANLTLNAVENLPVGGELRVRIRYGSHGGEQGAFITVADNGPGISSDDLEQIFEPFYSTKQGSGNGMGLWVVRSVVDRMGGEVQTRTRNGEGSYTVFRVFFPERSGKALTAATHS